MENEEILDIIIDEENPLEIQEIHDKEGEE